ncbi:MAG: hypothetical protein A2068_03720 [Ignavibacteria bacterium GWB2_35_6b]|nr:MAG: hypothetical protein A2068_03720 [Ignavibacteria bacterium GWB2_35_6b]OGU66304.1 MAG: hypothetical protein A2X62_12295 [Stygiobacter sp. GWC2_38_9]
MSEKELLDFCRVKKIFDKGFGFLASLYYEEPVFFHFNKVKDPDIKVKLEKLKRGEVYFFFTSVFHNGKRKVLKLWLDVKDIDKNLIPDFVERIIEEMNGGKINVFETAYVIKQLRENNFISKEKLEEILFSKKISKTPSVLKAIISNNEEGLSKKIDEAIELLETKKINYADFAEVVLRNFYNEDGH